MIAVAILSLMVISYQDFRTYSFHLIPFLVFTMSSFFINWTVLKCDLFFNALINLCYFCFLMMLMLLYFLLKGGRIKDIFTRYIGIGDLLFFLPLSLLFRPENLFFLFPVFLILILVVVTLIRAFEKKGSYNKQIPLAGYLSLLLIGLFLVKFFFKVDFFCITVL